MEQRRELKSCEHYCYPSKLLKCCACEDLRPFSPNGLYERYVDGVGWSTTAARDDGYCPICNTKNYDRWVKKVKAQTEKKQREEEEKKEVEQMKIKLMEEDRKRAMDTSNSQICHNVTFDYTNGNMYRGDMLRGSPHGFGRMEYADNDDDILYYEGEWKHGLHEGFGKKVWMDDMYYAGQWRNNMMHGQGRYHVNDVDIMEGLFEEDVFQD